MILGLDPLTVASFVGAGLVLNLTPGADVMFASASGMAGGPRVGVAAALGVALGGVLHTMLAAAGLAALLQANPAAYEAVRWAGAAYLVLLAIKALRAGPAARAQGAGALGAAVRRGFVTNALNPKVALFVLALLPQFTSPETGPVWAQILLLGGLFSLTGFFITASYGAAAGMLGHALGRASGWLNKLAGVVYLALAARLALD